MGSVLPARQGFSPLDDELALLPGRVTPRLLEELVHLATWMPFPQAAKHLKRSTRVELSEATVRRHTEAAGAAYVAVQTRAAEQILADGLAVPCAPPTAVVSVDGAMAPLRGGEWAEVKTLVVGELDHTTSAGGLHRLSYFSRLCDAATFGDAAVVETHRRGVPKAQQVAAVVDGAEWIQGFLDLHCPDAVRILDFPHAVEHLNAISHAVLGAGTDAAASWLAAQCHTLKHEGPTDVLVAVRALVAPDPTAAAVREHVAYLEKRQAQMAYPCYHAAGWPLGSGVVESGNKVVMEARLKGAGMRWARDNVNPMVALRTIVYSDRWEEGWEAIAAHRRGQEHQARRARWEQRRLSRGCADTRLANFLELRLDEVPRILLPRTRVHRGRGAAGYSPGVASIGPLANACNFRAWHHEGV